MSRIILILLLLVATTATGQIESSNTSHLTMYGDLIVPSPRDNLGDVYIHPLEHLCATRLVRNRALEMVNGNHEGVFNLAQACDIYDYFKQHWRYFSDPADEEYFAHASYSVKVMRGDCDDSAIAIAACVRAIGGQVRLIAAYNYYGGHAFAQVCIGSLSEKTVLQYLHSRYSSYPVIEVDPWGNRWLNLDLNYSEPGGLPFPHKKAFIYILGHPEMKVRFNNTYYGYFPTGQ